MLFMNIARRFGYMEEAGAEDKGGAGGAVTPTVPAEAKPAAVEPAAVAPVEAAAEPHAMDAYIEQYSTDKPALSIALGFLRDAGINPTDPAFQVAETDGDFELLKAILASKGLPGTEQMLAILEGEVNSHLDAIQEREDRTTQLVSEVLGEQQEAVFEWARSNATPEEQETINNMLHDGGVAALGAALALQQLYSKSDNTIPAANPVTQAKPTNGGGGAIDARTFAAETEALSKKFRGDPRGTREYAALQQRRAAGRKQGI